jgi:hypothetical protein
LAHRDPERVGVSVDEELDGVVGLTVPVTDRIRHQLADEQARGGRYLAGDDTLRAICAVSASLTRGLQICLELDLATPPGGREKDWS